MSDPTLTGHVHLRDHLERLIATERNIVEIALKAHDELHSSDARLLETALKAHDEIHAGEHRALQIAAAEYARRLDELNHAHNRETARAATFVPRELHEAARREIALRLEENLLQLTKLAATVAVHQSSLTSQASTQTWLVRLIIGGVLSLAGFLIIGFTSGRVRVPWI